MRGYADMWVTNEGHDPSKASLKFNLGPFTF